MMEKAAWIAFLLILPLVTALPKHKRVYPSSELAISEEGVHFFEQITVEDDIVRISVPQHRDVVASEIIMDTAKNISVRYVPSIHSCYMEPSARVRGNPSHNVFMEDPTRQTKPSREPALTVSHEWTPGFRILPSSLPEAISTLCRHAPLHLLKPLLPSYFPVQQQPSRNKRQVGSCVSPDNRCSLEIKACHYFPVRDCHQRTLDQNINIGPIIADRENTMIRCRDRQAHVIDKVMCCAPCCKDRASTDPARPYCENVWPECGEREEFTYVDAIAYSRQMRQQEDEEEQRQRNAELEEQRQRKAELEEQRQRNAELEEQTQRKAELEEQRQRNAELEEQRQRKAELEEQRQRKVELEKQRPNTTQYSGTDGDDDYPDLTVGPRPLSQ